MQASNLLSGLPSEAQPEELLSTLLEKPGVRIERIVSTGQSSPPDYWYDQAATEWILLVTGRAGIRFAGEARIRELVAGDWLCIPPHCRHQVAWTAQDIATVWLAIHVDEPHHAAAPAALATPHAATSEDPGPVHPPSHPAIEAAVRYLRWVRDGTIADGNPLATVAEHYRVSLGQVQHWLDSWANRHLPDHEECLADDIIRQMKIRGRQYRSYR